MSGVEWLVVLIGIGAIAWVNWYFLVAERSGPAASKARRESEVEQ